MAHVSVTISGRQYRMACDDGQEHHLARLSHELDQRIAHLRTTFGEIGDMRLTVMAALMEDVLFDLPDYPEKRIVFNEESVRQRLARIISDDDLRRYIL